MSEVVKVSPTMTLPALRHFLDRALVTFQGTTDLSVVFAILRLAYAAQQQPLGQPLPPRLIDPDLPCGRGSLLRHVERLLARVPPLLEQLPSSPLVRQIEAIHTKLSHGLR